MRNRKFDYLVLAALWLFATYWNLDKAFHIDDTGHLEIARWIEGNPLHPMSGLINWNDVYEPIHQLNQPHLYFYLMALWGHFWGYSEVSMHLLMSLFALWAISGFYRLATLLDRDNALVYTGLFAMSPGFVVGQNSMVDVPMMAIWIEFFYTLMNPAYGNVRRNGLASILCSAALLVKYTSVLLLPAMALHALLRRRPGDARWLLVPAAVLLLWSLFNWYDYGGVHLLGRSVASKSLGTYANLALAWTVLLGAISPFAIFAFLANAAHPHAGRIQPVWWVFALGALLAPTAVTISLVFPSAVGLNHALLWVSFMASGIGLPCLGVYRFAHPGGLGQDPVQRVLLAYWAVAAMCFVVLYAPFMAARHVLAAVPAIVLLTVPPLAHWKHFGKVAVFTWVVTAATTSMLAKADQWYASIYRDAPMLLAEKLAGKNGQTWFVGHWGWQWYAQKVGWRQWAPQSEQPQVGDHLIAPLQALGGDLPREVELALVGNYVLRPVNWVEHYASVGLYFNQYDLPWSYSTDLVEQFAVYRVAAVKDRVTPSGDKAP